MNKPKIFRVVHKTGCIRVYVGNFFSNPHQREINKLLRLAKINCTSEQQAALLRDLEEEQQNRRGREYDRIEKCIEKIKAMKWGR